MSEKKSFQLEELVRMLNPINYAGAINFAKDQNPNASVAKQIIDITLNANGTGVLGTEALKSALQQFITVRPNAGPAAAAAADEKKNQLFSLVKFYSTAGGIEDPKNPKTTKAIKTAWTYTKPDGKTSDVLQDLSQVFGTSVGKKPITILMSNSPYITPMTRNIEKAEVFLNGMPSPVLQRCVPYLDVEFQFDRKVDSRLATPGLLKFLLGTGEGGLSDGSANKAMTDAHKQLSSTDKTSEYTYAGAEIYTSPATLTNLSPGAQANRYVPVLDPFRPFLSLQGIEISVMPAIELYMYKRAKMTLKLHDRSRMSEISDMIKPEVYPRTTIWITYGWRHPDEPNNPYAVFINDNMMAREAYTISNSAFIFDQTGAVTLSLELTTKSISEMKTIKVDESLDSSTTLLRQLQQLRQDVMIYRQLNGQDQSEGVSREIRPFQILAAAEKGEHFDMTGKDATEALNALTAAIGRPNPKIDRVVLDRLIKSLKEVYQPGKTSFFERLRSTVDADIRRKFDAAIIGPDPFLPTALKDSKHPLAAFVDAFNLPPAGKAKKSGAAKKYEKRVVSLAKLISTFVLPALATNNSADDIQLFFYAFNEQAGAAAGTNIGEFPIEMNVFLDQWAQFVLNRGTERATLEEFILVLVQAQISDPHSIAYGLRSLYEPYAPNVEWKVKAKQAKNVESEEAKLLGKYGVFKKPIIEVYVETLSERPQASISPFDITSSAINSTNGSPAGDSKLRSQRILRIHIYDKQLDPYKSAMLFLQSDNSDGKFYEISADKVEKTAMILAKQSADANNKNVILDLAGVQSKDDSGQSRSLDLSTNAAIKEAIAQVVPTIVYGTSATTVIAASISTQQDALLGAINLQSFGKQNTTSPNGSGGGSLPLRVIPAALNMTTMGCPLLYPAQMYFIDFNSGTTIDNMYLITQLVHSFAPGKYESSMTFSFADAYGKYEGAQGLKSSMEQLIKGQQEQMKNEKVVAAAKKKNHSPGKVKKN